MGINLGGVIAGVRDRAIDRIAEIENAQRQINGATDAPLQKGVDGSGRGRPKSIDSSGPARQAALLVDKTIDPV